MTTVYRWKLRQRYNLDVKTGLCLRGFLFLTLLGMAGCHRAPETKDAVKQAVIEHLSKGSGLDISIMDIEVTSVAFQGKEANATVSFKPKSNPALGMQMPYKLEAQGDKWVVVRTGGGGNPHGSNEPPGDLPPGHPPVPSGSQSQPSGTKP
jgi:hypothetical protein